MAKARQKQVFEEGSAVCEREVNNPVFVNNMIMSLAERASQGDSQSAEALDQWLARYPGMRKLIRKLDDLRTTTEESWVRNLAGNDLVREKGIREDIASMRDELLARNASVLDKMMVSNVIVAHLADQSALLMASKPADHLSVAAARDRRAESTARRLQIATKGLTGIRERRAKGLAPRTKHKLFEVPSDTSGGNE
jgi:hypothetical protein